MGLVQVSLPAVDLDRAASFYADLLGRAPTARFDPPGLVFFDLDGVRLLLNAAGGAPPPSTPASILYLRVADLAAHIERLRARGVTIESDPHVIFAHETDALGPAGTDEWQAFVRDSEGNLVGLVEQVPPGG